MFQVVDFLRNAGVEVIGMVSIFNYVFDTAKDAFVAADVQLYSLTNYSSLLDLALKKGLIVEHEKEVLLNWRSDPANWTGVY